MLVLFTDLVHTSALVTQTGGRRAKTELLADLLRRADPAEIAPLIAFLSGATGRGALGIGYAALAAARPTAAAPAPGLELAQVDEALARVAATAGKGSAAVKRRLLAELLARATRDEQDFLFRLLIGELRQGALEGVMAEAIARATALDPAEVRRATMRAGDLAAVAHAALTAGAEGLRRFAVRLFRPLQPMLAQSATDVGDALARLGTAAFEPKLDGARVQVHVRGPAVRVYSRRLNEVTAAVPEVVAAAGALGAREAVLDGEAIALAPDGTPLPFQLTMRRFGRKLDVERLRAELPLSAFFFDVLAVDGASLVGEPYARRAERLDALVPERHRVARLVTGDPAAAGQFLAGVLAAGHEGVMAKALDAAYDAGARGAAWLKVKPAHTLDLVVLAAEWGHGRRRGRLSNLHLGARDPAGRGFVMLGKTFKGMSDELLAWQTDRLLALETTRDGRTVYVRPELVVEVAFDGVQASPQYPGGVALRFARVKGYRADKRAADADTIEAVRALHRGAART